MRRNETILQMDIAPADLFSALGEYHAQTFLLESSEGSSKMARFSFVGFGPRKRIESKDGIFKVDGQGREVGDPLAALKKEVEEGGRETEADGRAGFVGGAVGYFSYEFARQIEKRQNAGPAPGDDLGFPDFEFGIYDDAIVYDHEANEVRYVHAGPSRLEEIKRCIHGATFASEPVQMYNARASMSREEFCRKVEIAKERIRAGDIFQVVLSKRYEVKYSGSLVSFYKKLKAMNPSPYMYYLKSGGRQVIGSSPENLIKVEGRAVSSYATLAGTRPRGKTPQEDERLKEELLNDEKEKAEHLMLVDLTRNDIGKVAKGGSVEVDTLMEVHQYSHVQHMASHVKAELREGMDAYDALRAIFPAGTVSGAPKIRAMEIIDELEGAARGPYAGAVGYFSANGNADFAISIRTLFADRDKAYVQSGAGIVYDSVGEKEYEESENKAKALLHALGEDRYEAAIGR